jgi:thiol-disulfide isomerase/thioredoxin
LILVCRFRTGRFRILKPADPDLHQKKMTSRRDMRSHDIVRVITLVAFMAVPVSCIVSAQPKVPDFAIVSMDDSSKLITNESMLGTVYLVDFWATWCPPCVAEIPALTRAYEKFKDRRFEILSLSFDNSPHQVRVFREKRYRMSWMHGFVERGFGSHLARVFDVQNIPRQILVDENGTIVANDEELRGDQLEITLMKYLK